MEVRLLLKMIAAAHTLDAEDAGPLDAPARVESLLARAVALRASDLYLEPAADGVLVRFRLDGLLQTVDRLDPVAGRAAVMRLMVLSQLLTYQLDVPQEGRIAYEAAGGKLDLRLAVIPTTHGIRAAVRLPADLEAVQQLENLGLPANALRALERFAGADDGMLLVTGPAGSGKTTTLYALVAHIAARHPGLSIVTLEDPVERHLPGVTQIEVSAHGQLTYERALRSILRQDPQVLMLGEVRDAATASLAVQAALSGHRLVATLHAGSPGAAIARLLEMQIEPYQICSSVFGILSQRLLRRSAEGGYRGRQPIAEWAAVDPPLRAAILARSDAQTMQSVIASQPGYGSLRACADALVAEGRTDRAEVDRVLGPAQAPALARADAGMRSDATASPAATLSRAADGQPVTGDRKAT
jgi:type II secretory ATPase GspE/PulE/Tfp pilus assembly ATPase PilB-like protein